MRGKKRRGEPAAVVAESDKNALTVPQAGIILAVGLVFGLGVIYEWGQLNGFPGLTKWGWPWQDLGTIHIGLALLAPFVLIGLVLWSADRGWSRVPTGFWLGTMALANFYLQLFSVLADTRGAERILKIVASADATSYFTDALNIQRLPEWISHFDRASLHGHSLAHPPGAILFYYFFARFFGPDAGAFLGGCAVGLVASLGVVVMYSFAQLWTSDRRVRLLASAFYALVPGLIVFFPEFDQVYPIFSTLLILTFVKALDATRVWWRYAIGLGITLFAASFFAYNLLTIGVFLVLYCVYLVWSRPALTLGATLRTAGVALGICAFVYILLWAGTGYNAAAAFRHAWTTQAGAARWLNRPYSIFVFTDLYDFVLGAGIIVVPILWFHVRRVREEFKADPNGTALTVIGLATVLIVDLSGVLRGETTRVWLFLQPLLVAPVAVELARLRWPWRLSILAMQWWILVLLKAKMSFVEP